MRALIVDDEAHALRRLTHLLGECDDVEIVGTCMVATDVAALAAETEPDVCLLDVEMPELSGLDLAASLSCPIIFVTAHERHALDAFDVDAVDFVVKPVERHRLRRALDRVRRRSTVHAEVPLRSEPPLRRILVRCDESLIPIDMRNVDYLQAVGNYVKVHLGRVSYLVRATLGSLEKRLDADAFIRTHRAYIVNHARVRELRPISHGDYEVLLTSGTSVPFSRGYRMHLVKFGLVDGR
jgi:two-component system, LytTR family, response regulator